MYENPILGETDRLIHWVIADKNMKSRLKFSAVLKLFASASGRYSKTASTLVGVPSCMCYLSLQGPYSLYVTGRSQ